MDRSALSLFASAFVTAGVVVYGNGDLAGFGAGAGVSFAGP